MVTLVRVKKFLSKLKHLHISFNIHKKSIKSIKVKTTIKKKLSQTEFVKPELSSSKIDDFFGSTDTRWNWERFQSTQGFPVSEELMDWIIGQERAITECKLCIDEWIAKLLYLKKKEWWKAFENPMGHKPQSKEMLPAGPFLLMLGDAGCLIGDERIALRDGTFDKLENLGQTHLQDIHVPLFQYGKMSEKYRGTAEVFHRYENQPVMEVITESGKRIVGTYNHPLLTKEGWKRLDQLTKTDYLRVVTKIPCWKKNYYGFIDEKIGGLLGYALADGGIDKYALTLYISNKEQDLIPKLQSIIRESFNEEPNLWVRKAHGVNRTIDMNILEIDRKWVAEKLSFLKEKRVPIGIIQSPDSVVASFLSWFFTGDGSVFSKGRGHYAITAEQSEERIELLRDIQILLLRFGIYSIVKGRHLKIQRGKSIERFAKYIGFQTKEKQEKLMGLVVYVSGRRQKHNQLWERVISIKPMGITTVYDVEVPYHHHFIANGIVSHNTGKSLLGRAMTNYMTEIYKKNGIKLTDIVAWKNPSIPQEPKISIHPTPTGKEIIMKATKAVKKKSFLSRWGLKLVQGFMIGLGLVLTFISFYWIFAPWITNSDFSFGQSIQEYYGGNFMSYLMSTLPPLAPLLGIGVTMMFSGIFIGIIGKMMGNVGNNQEGIGGASSSKAPKLLVDNSSERAPFIDATGHGSSQLFGSIAWDPYQTGGLGTPEHQRCTAGDVHRAHLGILFIDEIKNLIGMEVITLLTVLEDGQLPIALRSQYHGGDTAAMAVATEPVPCMFFLVAAGNLDSLKQIHPALLDRIYGYGKVVYMNNEMSATPENRRKYIQFMAQEIKRFNLLPFSRDACVAIIEEAARRSGRNDQLTCKFRPMIGAIKTASVLARNEKCELVERRHVEEALSEHCKSIGLQVTEKLIERIKVYSHIDPKAKPKIGQIHGLAVSSINAESNDFVGSVLAIRASCVQKTDRKSEGYFHVTGVQMKDNSYVQHSISKVEHVINQLFNINLEHDFMTHVDFAQDHNVEGPSAGITMTLALISCLSRRKIYQNVAVTGEINIGCGGIGEDTIVITPIGGAHEKIMAAQNMGFEKVCIPKRNFEKNIDLKNYKIKIVGCTTLEDYVRECLEPEKKP